MRKTTWLFTTIILSFLLFLAGCGIAQKPDSKAGQVEPLATTQKTASVKTEALPPEPYTTIKVHFLDVGQGDSILIQTPNKAILVDGGTASAGQTVINYIKAQGITKLDAVVATHPHEDHIGGLVKVIPAFPVTNFHMPNKSHTTRTFENLIGVVNQSGAKRIQAKAGVAFELDGIKAKFIAPNSTSYSSLNDYSAVLKITHGSNAFLLTGDAESRSEQEMIGAGLKADVLKVGHHGSNSSTTSSFLKAVSPKAAVISAGRGNSYGHPHQEVLNRLQNAGVEVYRTDEQGMIIATSDGQKVTFNVKANAPPAKKSTSQSTVTGGSTSTGKDVTVYLTNTGTKYHRGNCRMLKKSKIENKLSDVKGNYEPCKICNPQR